MSQNTYEPGTYVKGDVEREAYTASDAVALAFEGFKRKEVTPEVETVSVYSGQSPEPVRTYAAEPTPEPGKPTRKSQEDPSK